MTLILKHIRHPIEFPDFYVQTNGTSTQVLCILEPGSCDMANSNKWQEFLSLKVVKVRW